MAEASSYPDVLVVGGGVIGTSVLYHLAAAGVRGRLLERDSVCGAASGANAAFIWPQAMKRKLSLEMTLASFEIFPTLAEALGEDVGYQRTGGLLAADSEAQIPILQEYMSAQPGVGLPAELLDGDEARRREPALGPGVPMALYMPLGGKIDPFRLAIGFAQAARRLGATIEAFTPVRGFVVEGGRAGGVLTDRGTIRAGTVIVCAGAWSGEVTRLAGLEVPVIPRQGQMVVTEPAPFKLHHCVKPIKHDQDWELYSQARPRELDYARFGAGQTEDPNLPPGKGMAIQQSGSGAVLLGSTSRFVGFNQRPTESGIHYIVDHAMRILPGLGRLQMVRAWAGLRPFTPDGLPVIGPTSIPGLVLATGHDGGGVGLAPVTGRLVAELVTTGRMSMPLEKLTPERFATAQSAAAERRVR